MSFNFVRQLDGMDCGPACLCMISRHYGKQYTLQEIRDLVNISKTGSSFLGLCDAAEKIGLRTSASMPTFEYFVKNVKLPCIVYWGQQHFVVVYKLKKKRSKYIFYVADPAYGLLKYDEDFFKHKWITIIKENKERGAIISFTSTPYFSKNDLVTKKKVIYNSHFLWNYIRPYRNMLFQLFLGILIGCIIQLLFPLLTKAMVDFGIGARKLNFVYLILLSQLFLVLGALSVDIVRRWIMLQITTRINISLVSDFLMKLMKLPMRFFDSKLKGDLIQRINDHNRIEFFLTKTLLNSLFSLLSILVFGFVLLLFDITLFLILLIGCFLYITWVLFFLKRRANIDYKNFSVMSVYQSNIIEMIEGMQEIKLTNSEKQKRWQWENIQTQIFEIKQKSLSLEQVQQIGSVFIMEIINVVVTVISVTSVIKGIISLGTMLSIQYIMGQIQTPVNQLVNIIQQIQNAKISMNRLSEIHNSNDEQQPNKYKEIKGTESIKIEKITFSYGSLRSKNVIDGISFSIPAGKMTAIVGLSGSGKTTLIKLILGFYPVNSGKIFIGNNQISDYSFKKWRQHCGVVMQDGFIFSDTIANNITIGDMTPDMEKLKIVADITNVSKFAENFPLGYKTIIGDSGMGLSQGQKQRILLARAIYNNPDYLFLDEATNALDAINEKDILLKLKSFCKNKTMIIVAHRLSTVKQADNIIVLENGKIVEQGKHIELINHQRIYFNLIKDQLNISK